MKKISLRDMLILIGFSLFGCGLWLYKPFIAYIVCGFMILVGGLRMEDK